MGKHALVQASRTLHSLASCISANGPYLQFLYVTTRMMSCLYGRGTLRSLPEEFNLAVNMKAHDALSAEFWRTYTIQDFRGSAFLRELEKELLASALHRPIGKVLPVRRPGSKDRNACLCRWSLYTDGVAQILVYIICLHGSSICTGCRSAWSLRTCIG